MSESVQAVLALLLIVGAMGSVMVFVTDHVNWTVFAGMVALTVGSLGLLIWSLFRRDKVPDFLKKVPGPLLERDGFCFKLLANRRKGLCTLDLHFQNRYDLPTRALVVIQPSKGFFLNRPDLAGMTVEVDCPEGAYGVTAVPWPVVKKFQGKVQSLDVGADVLHPEGKGKMIRYKGGGQVGPAGRDTWGIVMTVAGALGGMIVLTSPAKLKLKLPADVEESVSDDLPITTEIVWKLGDAVVDHS